MHAIQRSDRVPGRSLIVQTIFRADHFSLDGVPRSAAAARERLGELRRAADIDRRDFAAIALFNTRSTDSGKSRSGRIFRSGIGSLRSRAIIISCCVRPWNGSFPVSISYVMSAERIDVGARIERLAAQLLRAHELRRAENDAGRRQLLQLGAGLPLLGETEVHDDGVLAVRRRRARP